MPTRILTCSTIGSPRRPPRSCNSAITCTAAWAWTSPTRWTATTRQSRTLPDCLVDRHTASTWWESYVHRTDPRAEAAASRTTAVLLESHLAGRGQGDG